MHRVKTFKHFRYGDDSGFGDQSSTAMILGGSAAGLGLRCAMYMFGSVVTLGVGALALGTALKSSYSQNSERLAASRSHLANASSNIGPVAARSALGASAKSAHRLTKGEDPRHTFPKEFGSTFVSGMATELVYDAGSQMMTSKANLSNSDDTNEPRGQNAASSSSVAYASEKAGPVAARSALGAAMKSGYRFMRGENPLQTFPAEFASKFVNGMIT